MSKKLKEEGFYSPKSLPLTPPTLSSLPTISEFNVLDISNIPSERLPRSSASSEPISQIKLKEKILEELKIIDTATNGNQLIFTNISPESDFKVLKSPKTNKVIGYEYNGDQYHLCNSNGVILSKTFKNHNVPGNEWQPHSEDLVPIDNAVYTIENLQNKILTELNSDQNQDLANNLDHLTTRSNNRDLKWERGRDGDLILKLGSFDSGAVKRLDLEAKKDQESACVSLDKGKRTAKISLKSKPSSDHLSDGVSRIKKGDYYISIQGLISIDDLETFLSSFRQEIHQDTSRYASGSEITSPSQTQRSIAMSASPSPSINKVRDVEGMTEEALRELEKRYSSLSPRSGSDRFR